VKRRNKSRKLLTFIFFITVVALFCSIIFKPFTHISSSSQRPEYCVDAPPDFKPYHPTVILKDGKKCINNDFVFQNLPPYPKDMREIYELVYYRKINDLSIINESYYKNPEFYPGWYYTGKDTFLNPPINRFGAFGYGCYPADTIAFVKPGQALKLTTFIKSGWVVETFQGMQLIPTFPSSANSSYMGWSVEQDPEKVKDYFIIDIEPDVFLLEPAFPVFLEGWARKITVDIKIKPNTPPGRYVIGIMPVNPPQEYSDKWLLKYKLRYVDIGSSPGSIGRPCYQVFIEVSK